MMQSPRKWDLGLSVHNIANAVYDVHGPICTIIASHPGIALPKVIYGGGIMPDIEYTDEEIRKMCVEQYRKDGVLDG